MPSVRAVLERREKAAAAQVEELRAEFERVRAALSDAEEVLNQRVIGLEQYLEALAEQNTAAEEADPAAGSRPVVVEPRRTVARKRDGVSVDVLGTDYRRIMDAAGEAAGDGLSARQVAVLLGWDSSLATRVEGARSRLKRLVERGWLIEERPGRFMLPLPGTAAKSA